MQDLRPSLAVRGKANNVGCALRTRTEDWPMRWKESACAVRTLRLLQDNLPVIDWERTSAKDSKDSRLNATTKSDKHRNSKWLSDFVNGRDDKADRTKLDAPKITLPATLTAKGK